MSDLNKLVEALEAANEAMNTCMDHCYSDGSLHHQSYDSEKLGAAHLLIREALDSRRASQQEGEYRNLRDKEDVIQEGDEYSPGDDVWLPHVCYGTRFDADVHYPSRRPTRKETQG